MDAVENPLLSIVITSYTTERLGDIFDLLESVKKQTYKNIEVIFVVEGSEELHDRIELYVKKEAILNVKVMSNKSEPGASAARNLGIATAHGEIIAFVDDDVVLFPDWAEEMVKTYQDESIVGVIGPVSPLWEDPLSMNWIPSELHWVLSCTNWVDWKGIVPVVGHTWTSNASFRKEALGENRLFSTALGPIRGIPGWRRAGISEDVELAMRVIKKINKNIVYNSFVKACKKVPKERLLLRSVARNAYGIGVSRIIRRQRFPDLIKSNTLPEEQRLLKRIFNKVVPDILKNIPERPADAWREFSLTMIALLFVAFGYYMCMFTNLLKRNELD